MCFLSSDSSSIYKFHIYANVAAVSSFSKCKQALIPAFHQNKVSRRTLKIHTKHL